MGGEEFRQQVCGNEMRCLGCLTIWMDMGRKEGEGDGVAPSQEKMSENERSGAVARVGGQGGIYTAACGQTPRHRKAR